MKKIIAILLVLVVGFSAFAIDGDADATLTLKSTVGGQTYHGFSATEYTAAPAMKTGLNTGGADVDGNNEVTISFTDNNDQDVGYYNFYTTGNFGATVDFTISPLSYYDGTSTYYVPYTFKYAASANGATGSGGITFTAGSTSFASSEVSTTEINEVTIEDLLTATGAGLRWRAIGLSVNFDAEDIDEFGLPETADGEFFTATIIADVTAQ